MASILRVIIFAFCFKTATFDEQSCVIELDCPECVPEHMPLVTSHRAVEGRVRVRVGDEARLWCGAGGFVRDRRRALAVTVVCAAGPARYRLPDGSLRHLLQLGCQESVFEDVTHAVELCEGPLEGRVYQVQQEGGRARPLAAFCYDGERGRAVRARLAAGGLLGPGRSGRLSLLGSLQHVVTARTRQEAERLFEDDERAARRLRYLLRHERVTFAGQTLTAAKLLSAHYFDDQDIRASDFVSNKVASWSSVAAGNLKHLQNDVARLVKKARGSSLEVFVGTRGVMALRVSDGKAEVELGEGGRFPMPLYIWTVVMDPSSRRGVALVLLNDPFVAVSEIRDAVFCESACSRVSWLKELRHNRNYESPIYGLVFCCSLHNFTDVVTEMPKRLVGDIKSGEDGILTEYNVNN